MAQVSTTQGGPSLRAVDILRKKRDGQVLSVEEMEAFVAGATSGEWPDYQVAAMLMAIVCRGMEAAETAALTAAMVGSGVKLDLSDLSGPKLDKHSTGGVGDKVSLVLAPLVASCGGIVPMMSGRGLGHSGGTLDKLEAIPGFRVGLSLEELHRALRVVGCALIGQTAEIAPADKRLYALRDVTATVESIPLITASILSKKIAEGIDALALDVKVGRGAFMKTEAEARRLAESLVTIGNAHGVQTEALLTNMDAPLGRAVGHTLEVIEALEVLKGQGPDDVRELSLELAAAMLRMGRICSSMGEARIKVQVALSNGRGLEKFRQIIEHQGGDPRVVDDYGRLPTAPFQAVLRAEQAGYVHAIDALHIAEGTIRLGAGRNRVEDVIDHAVGVVLKVRPGEVVQIGSPLLEIHYRHEAQLAAALPLFRQAFVVADQPPDFKPLVLDTVPGSPA